MPADLPDTDFSRFSTPPVELASIDDLFAARPGRDGGAWRVAFCKSWLDLEVARRASDTLLVVFSGARVKRLHQSIPFFSGRTLGETVGLTTLLISDPALYRSRDLLLGWYAGTDDVPLDDILPRLIQEVARNAGCRRVLLVGGSGGGFAALKVAETLPDALALVWNPQIEIAAYKPGPRRDYALSAWGRDAASADAFLEAPRFKVEPHSARYPVVYLQNINDDLHKARHMSAYFGDRLRGIDLDAPVSKSLGPTAYLHIEDFGPGHHPPNKRTVTALVHALGQPDVDWTEPLDPPRIEAALDPATEAPGAEGVAGEDPVFAELQSLTTRHIIATRLGIGECRRGWYRSRIARLVETTLPSLLHQRNQDFEWVICVDHMIDAQSWSDLNEATSAHGKIRLRKVDPIEDGLSPSLETLLDDGPTDVDVILLTRLDEADALTDRFTAWAAGAVNDIEAEFPMALSWVDGLQLDLPAARVTPVRERFNAFGMTIVCRPEEMQNIYGFNRRKIHEDIEAAGGVARRIRSQTPAFLKVRYAETSVDGSGPSLEALRKLKSVSARLTTLLENCGLENDWLRRVVDLPPMPPPPEWPLASELSSAQLKNQLLRWARAARKRGLPTDALAMALYML